MLIRWRLTQLLALCNQVGQADVGPGKAQVFLVITFKLLTFGYFLISLA